MVRKNRKGIAQAVIFIALLAGFGVLVSLAALNNLISGPEGITRQLTFHQKIYSMGNALEAAKIYLDASLSYSFYQSCFDVLGRGGYSQVPPSLQYKSPDRILAL
jgi:hypothetical protein